MFTGCGGIGQCYAKVDVNFSLFCAAGRRVVGGGGWGMGGKELFLKVFVFLFSPRRVSDLLAAFLMASTFLFVI